MVSGSRQFLRPLAATFAVLVAAASASAKLVPDQIDSFFIHPDRPQSLAFRSDAALEASPTFQIKNYTGQVLREGRAEFSADRVTLPVTLAPGFYEIVFSETQQSFGVAAIAPFEGKTDPFFGLDSALSWLELRSDMRDGLVRILKRSGIGISRERLSLGGINPKPDTWDWQTNRKYDALRKAYTENGVQVLEMFYGMQGHTAKKGDLFPQELVPLAQSWQQVCARFSSSWSAVEVWNEPDLVAVPADQYAPLAKVAAYAHKRAGVAAPIVGGVYTGYAPGTYQQVCAANGMLENVDVVSFHMYEDAPEVEPMTRQYRAWLKSAGRESMPLWLTESGRPWNIGPDRAPMDQDAKTAMEIAAKAAECRALGISGYYPFVYVFYEEAGAKNFGMMGREVTPLRAMAAYVFSVRTLAHQPYLGDLKVNPAGVKIARVFGNGAARIVVLYSGKLNGDATVKLPFAVRQAFGADGRALAIGADGAVSIADGITYIFTDAAALNAHLNPQSQAASLLALSRQPLPARAEPSPIILQHDSKKLKSRVSSRRYLIDEPTARELAISVRVQNLSEQSQTVTPTLQLPDTAGVAGKSFALPALEVAGLQSRDISWTIDASGALDPTQMRFIRITAAASAGPAISPLAIPLVMEADLATHMARHGMKIAQPIDQIARWRQNHAPSGTCKFSVTDTTWSMNVDFGKSGVTWCYPRFELPQRIDPATCTGVLFRARIQHPARNVALMAFEKGKATFWVNEVLPADGQWHSVFVPLDEFKPMNGHPDMQNAIFRPERIEDISLGMSSNVPTNKLEISDLLLVGRAPNPLKKDNP